jgi:hypothetical protein
MAFRFRSEIVLTSHWLFVGVLRIGYLGHVGISATVGRINQLGDDPEQLEPPVEAQWFDPLNLGRPDQRLAALNPDADPHGGGFPGTLDRAPRLLPSGDL